MNDNSNTENFKYKAEVSQLLNIVTNSLYSNKEIFLRELISNSFDAIEKLRFMSMTNNDFNQKKKEYKIYVDFDTKNSTISINDNGKTWKSKFSILINCSIANQDYIHSIFHNCD